MINTVSVLEKILLYFIYIPLRVLTRILLGGKARRIRFFRCKGWTTSELFFKFLKVPRCIIFNLMVYELLRSINSNRFCHEPKVTNCLRTKHGKSFIDIGANFGYYSFLLHPNFERILAIEPHPENVRVINEVKQKYGYSKVEILEFAVSDEDGDTRLYTGRHSGGHSLLRNPQLDSPQFINVKTKTLANILGSDVADLVKVDVEGAEWQVLKGAEPVVENIKNWVVELHNPNRKQDMENWFRSHGYQFKWLDFNGETGNHIFAWRE